MREAIEHFLADAGGADLVIANAGVGIRSALAEGEAAEVARLFEINLIGVTNTLIPFLPRMLAQRSGVLCAVSSVAGHRALPGRVAYAASK
jgi:NADP-dependent 3-hydroxy acid dehydrogenase YdfG